MNEPKNILVPLDLSERSRIALSYAAMLAEHLGSCLTLMTNVNLPELEILQDSVDGGSVDEGSANIEEAGHAHLMALADELAPGLDADTAFSFHDFPADGILAEASDRQVDMIVLASHGRSGMSRWLLGSVAEKVARAAEVPVVIVPARDR